jgi:phosphomevalonate kinase
VRAKAPGKLVISGAYAVLYGAPSIVSAVSRWVLADSSRRPDFVTPEVKAAVSDERAPWFDASELRQDDRKLGLGSSAAILVASLAVLEMELERGSLTDAELAEAILPRALRAHQKAQGGGSGIDVLASCRGGTLVAQKKPQGDELEFHSVELPSGLVIEVWAANAPASTSALVAQVAALERTDAARHRELIGELSLAAENAVGSLDDAAGFVEALCRQASALALLGAAASAPIVTADTAELAAIARVEDAIVLPAGAGGGDVALYVGPNPPSRGLVARREALGHSRLSLSLGARGVHDATSIG